MAHIITDVETWLLDESERVYRFLVYRRLFTPYEQQQAFCDESQFESDYYSFGIIEEAMDLSIGDWLLGIREIIDGELSDELVYYRLSEIRLSYREEDKYLLNEYAEMGMEEGENNT